MKINPKYIIIFLTGLIFFIKNLFPALSFSYITAIINLQNSNSKFVINSSSMNLDTSLKNGRYIVMSSYFNSLIYFVKTYSFNGVGNPALVYRISIPEAASSIDCSPDQRFFAIGRFNADHCYVYKINHVKSSTSQILSNSLIFGNSALGLCYDLNIRSLSGAKIEIDRLVDNDNVDVLNL